MTHIDSGSHIFPVICFESLDTSVKLVVIDWCCE